MSSVAQELRRIKGVDVRENESLAGRTRFGIGGAADIFVETAEAEAIARTVRVCRDAALPVYVLGEGSNVIVSDDGFPGLILQFTGKCISIDGNQVEAEAGATLQSLVTATVDAGLAGLHTLERIPGLVGGAVYGNAGAYGRQIDEIHVETRYFDGADFQTRTDCEFEYRESIFKQNKDWVILSTRLKMESADPAELRAEARRIRQVRDEKFPTTMRCAGSIFKNFFLSDLPREAAKLVPEAAVRGGKVASAYFLERVGAKGMREGGIEIASYHANLIYNAGGGTAAELRKLIGELKRRVREEFGFEVSEEVQYIGEFKE